MENHMRGAWHARLTAVLRQKIAEGRGVTQESLGTVVKRHQTTVGGILDPKKSKGTFDLDQAEAALQHIGSSLHDFVTGVPPRELSRTDRLVRRLEAVPELRDAVEALLDVPKRGHAFAIQWIQQYVQAHPRKPPTGTPGSPAGQNPGGRNKSASKKHR